MIVSREGRDMPNVFGNLRLLKNDMEEKEWVIDSFLFRYNDINYIVLVKLYKEDEKKPKYALLKLEFIQQDNFNHRLLVPANSNGFMTDIVSIVVIRNFFGVEYQENLGNFQDQFQEYLAGFIPTEVSENKNEAERRVMVIDLSESDSENPNKLYCTSVMRNPEVNGRQKERSIYNDNKTRLLRPELYEEYADDRTISFRYSENPDDEKTTEEIMNNFAARPRRG